jgi:hypothetical protein
MRRRDRDMELVGPWRRLHAAVWLIGLAILFWRGWFWPGILVLVAISALIEVLLMQFAPQAFAEADATTPPSTAPPPSPAAPLAPEHRAELLPSACPRCGAPVRSAEVRWVGPQAADCPYCGAHLPMRSD